MAVKYSESFLDLVRAYPTKYKLHEIEALVDKIVAYLSEKKSNFFYNLLTQEKQAYYKKALNESNIRKTLPDIFNEKLY